MTPDSSGYDAAPLPRVSAREGVRHAALFVATFASMALTYAAADQGDPRAGSSWRHGVVFASALLLILSAHELGHYIAARIHRVQATLPFFIPLPLLSPFGTMGAVIRMQGTIRSRKALLDIGAAGPLAGLAFAIPMYAWGIRHSVVVALDSSQYGTYGDSLLSRALDGVFGPHLAPGTVQVASPVLFAAWAGFFVTMLNLLPIGQLDGGHIAYALFGRAQDRAAVVIHRSLLAFFLVKLVSSVAFDLRAGWGFYHLGQNVNDSLFWFGWFEALGVLGSLTQPKTNARAGRDPDGEVLSVGTRVTAVVALVVLAAIGREHAYPTLWAAWFVGLTLLLVMERRGGTLRPHSLFDHPPVGTSPLGPVRTTIAVVSLAFFVALFMPTPFTL